MQQSTRQAVARVQRALRMRGMTLAERMLRDLKSTFDGTGTWHGTPLRRMIARVDDARGDAHPIAGARSIKELLAHATSWIEIVDRRIGGEAYDPPLEVDFPAVDGISMAALLARLDAAHARLLDRVSTLRDEDFDATVPGKRYTIDFMLRGLVHHTTYHAAQIAMLMKMV
jgi:uncharacterized damage-inducible protein DinB